MAPRQRLRATAGACAVLLVLFLSGCLVPDPAPADKLVYPSATVPRVLENVAYAPDPYDKLDVYSPPNRNGGTIVWLHGGGWGDEDSTPGSVVSKDQAGFQPVVQDLYRRGWTVLSVRYAGTDESTFPEPIYDTKLAIRWAKKHAGELGVSPSSVVVMGWSAGGHLAALADLSAGSLEPTRVPADLVGISSRPAEAVSIAGVLDPATFALDPGIGGSNPAAVAALIGCPTTPGQWQTCNPALLQATRPVPYADAGDPPLYVAQGDQDGIVNPQSQALDPYTALVKVLGEGGVWLDMVNTGSPASYGGVDPRNHTLATSYEINLTQLHGFLDRVLPAAPPPLTAARFTPIAPCRLGDTRVGAPFTRLSTTALRATVWGRCGVPAGATSGVVTATIVRPPSAGTVTVRATGSSTDSPVLAYGAGEVRAVTFVAPLSATGQIDVKGLAAGAGLILDVAGALSPAVAATSGRYLAVAPARVFDSGTTALSAGTTTTVDTTAALVPADAVSVVLRVTFAGTGGGGFVSLTAAGSAVPPTSALNADAAGQTRSTTVVVPLSASGAVDVRQSMEAQLAVDVVGYFTGPTASMDRAGLYAGGPAKVFGDQAGWFLPA
jgi:acetyl esterase/lipase